MPAPPPVAPVCTSVRASAEGRHSEQAEGGGGWGERGGGRGPRAEREPSETARAVGGMGAARESPFVPSPLGLYGCA
jgi:hypothetical protein